NAVRGVKDADVAGAADPDTVAGEQINVFLNAAFEVLTEALDVFLEAVIAFILKPTDAKSVRGETGTTILFEDFENFFPLAHAVKERRERPDVEGVGAEPEKVAGDALELGEDSANDF